MPRSSGPCTAPARPSSSLPSLSDGKAPHPRLILGWPPHVPRSSRPPRPSTRCGGLQPKNDTKIISNRSTTDLKLSYHGHVTLSSSAALQKGLDLPLGLFPVGLQGDHPVYEHLEKILGDNVTFLTAVHYRFVGFKSVKRDTY